MMICVHVFNISDPNFAALYANGGGNYSPENLPTTSHSVQYNTPATDIVKVILHAAGGSQIQVLRTVAHGNSGVYYFPGLWNVNLISADYAQLRSVFAPNARFELHGCGLASETDIVKPGVDPRDARVENTVPGTFSGKTNGAGLVYLRRVASVFGVQVVAGINVQFVSQNSWRFEGDTVTVFPNGKFAMDSEGTREWDVASREKAAREYLERIVKNMIAKGLLPEARLALQNLIGTYKNTKAAAQAAERLKNQDLKLPLQILPDGSLVL